MSSNTETIHRPVVLLQLLQRFSTVQCSWSIACQACYDHSRSIVASFFFLVPPCFFGPPMLFWSPQFEGAWASFKICPAVQTVAVSILRGRNLITKGHLRTLLVMQKIWCRRGQMKVERYIDLASYMYVWSGNSYSECTHACSVSWPTEYLSF